MKNGIRDGIKLIAAASLLFQLGMFSAFAGPSAQIYPAAAAVAAGSAFDISINVLDVVDLFAYEFDISFNPTVLAATGVDEGLFLQTGGSTIFVPGTIDNTIGAISFTDDALIGALSGVGGSGTLATIHFYALSSGVSPIDISGLTLLDSNLAVLSASTQGAMVDVSGVSGVPEPATLTLMGVSLIAMVAVGRARRRSPRGKARCAGGASNSRSSGRPRLSVTSSF